jgi:hypothetical protein
MPDEGGVAARLLDLPCFRRELRKVTLVSVAEQFPMLTVEEGITGAEIDLNYILECASVLAHSERGVCQDAALRVAHFVLSRTTATEGQKAAAAIVLDVLTNRPALGLAVRRELVSGDVLEHVPPPLLLDALRREVEFSIADAATGELSMLNRFQMKVYRSVEDVPWVSVSAPTSSGKSFILERAVRDALIAGTARRIVYIVPTRALVQEVELDFRDKLAAVTPPPLITSVPQIPPHDENAAIVLVFTQERLQLLLTDMPDFAPDMIVVDEAQKIGEGARGVLLEQVLDEVARRKPTVRIVFASPMTENPEILLEYAPEAVTSLPVSSEQVAVNQNLVWVSQVRGKPTHWTMELCLGDEIVPLGTFTLPNKPSPDSKRLPLGAGGGNLVYVKGAADAEDIARLLAAHFREDKSDDAELTALRDLAQKTIHEDYALAETVQFGVAFHYGNMPLIIRSEIERLFRAGKLRYLVCTSTLIEGVNLPATSIFVRGPQKGVGKPMNEIDFWNLAGRAGRQGKEFQGNIVCVDARVPGVWKSPPPTYRRRYVIERNTRRVLTKRGDALVDYIVGGTPRSTTREYDELESAFVYVLGEHLRYDGLANSPKMAKLDAEFIARLQQACADAYATVELPVELLSRNPGVSPLAQQNLLNYFRGKDSIEESMPADPASIDARDSYLRVIGITSQYLSGDPQQLNFPRAILVVNWMRGHALARLIAEAWKYWEPRGEKLANVIRRTMAEIEEYARFRFAKYSACYVDVLRFHLTQTNRADLIADIPRLNMWLEFGTSIVTQLSLIGLGLSRTSAIELSRLIPEDNLDMDASLQRLRELNLEGTNLSPIIVNEVRRMLGVAKIA